MLKYSGQIAEITDNINLIDNWVDIRLKNDKYATKSEVIKVQISDLNNLVNSEIKNIIQQELISNYNYTEYTDTWDYPEWQYRFYVSNSNIAFLTANYFEWVQSLYTEPVNPKVSLSEGMLVYCNSVLPEALPLLQNLGIEIEVKQ